MTERTKKVEGDNGTKRIENGELLKVKRGGYSEYGRRTNIWEYGIGKGQSTKDNIAFEHPAIFPEQLANDHIISWSNEGRRYCLRFPFTEVEQLVKMAI